jgi:SAM-dependent methyltransferase
MTKTTATNGNKRSASLPTTGIDPASAITLHIGSKASIIHIGSLDSFEVTEGGKDAATKLLEYLDTGKVESLQSAVDIYEEIIPKENYGGEYTALRWICKLLMIPKQERTKLLSDPFAASWYDMLSKDYFTNLKTYLQIKYHFVEITREDRDANEKLRFLEDFVCFNNPDRETWDKTTEIIQSLNLQEGDSIIDFGCGPGYVTLRFADLVGEKGHVYGIETNEMHINYLKNFIEKNHVKNVDIFEYQATGWGLKSSAKADFIYMCSLYHILYAAFTDRERDLFIGNVKNYLKDDGLLVIVDNDLVEGEGLPYHGPYISRELIISQLWHYGFELVAQYQFTLQRYVLQFKLSTTPQRKISDPPVLVPAMFADAESRNVIRVTSPSSLVRFRMIGRPTEGYTLLGKKAARLFYAALEKKDKATVKAALEAYEALIPTERIGDEYTVFEWFCKYLLASTEQQTQLLSDKFDAEYFDHLANDDFAFLKKYVRIKYDLGSPDPEAPRTGDEFADTRVHDVTYEYSGDEVGFDKLNEWNEFVVFNNINRESWEKTSEMLNYINIEDGEVVADVGCGFGFFSFKFAEQVGRNGFVYSTEINKNYLEHVEKISSKFGLNITTFQSRFDDVGLPPDSVDTIFMCSMYHYTYLATIEFVKDKFIASLKRALKQGGRLVIVDNDITPPPVVAYHGSGIAKELTISQLKYYGFDLVDSKQFIPQRYVLVFQQG